MNTVVLVLFVFLAQSLLAQSTARIPMAELKDRIKGGWAGQMIGVSYGAPTEFRYRERIIPRQELPQWTPEKIRNSLNQDDLYVDMTFAKVLDDKGLEATTEDFGQMFREARYALWHANLAARRALKRGVPAALSGTPKYNAHADDIDFQIESDFVGLMAPGLPRSSNRIAERAGRVMNYGDGLYGGLFVSCMYADAFFEKDPEKIVRAGLACLPSKSRYHRMMSDVLTWSKQNPDWEVTWKQIEEKWNRDEPCPEGALQPFNIDAALNGAYIVLGLMYGNGDWDRTLEVSTRAGQDSDCNPASAMGILGVMLGYEKIPDRWKSGIPALENEKFRYTDFTFLTIVDSTVSRAVALVEKTGGKREGDDLIIKRQKARPAKYEVFRHGAPKERIAASDSRWKFQGDWQSQSDSTRESSRSIRTAAKKDAEASIAFEGTGVLVTSIFQPTCGKADVYLDGKLRGTVDCYPDEDSRKGGEALWHDFALSRGKHELRVVVRGEGIFDSKGSDIVLTGLVVFE